MSCFKPVLCRALFHGVRLNARTGLRRRGAPGDRDDSEDEEEEEEQEEEEEEGEEDALVGEMDTLGLSKGGVHGRGRAWTFGTLNPKP
jgi:hypothetical protein